MAVPRKAPKRITETLTISLDPAAAELLRKRAKRLHGGNVSALVSEMIDDARISEDLAELVETEGLGELSAAALRKFDLQMDLARKHQLDAASKVTKKRGRAA